MFILSSAFLMHIPQYLHNVTTNKTPTHQESLTLALIIQIGKGGIVFISNNFQQFGFPEIVILLHLGGNNISSYPLFVVIYTLS